MSDLIDATVVSSRVDVWMDPLRGEYEADTPRESHHGHVGHYFRTQRIERYLDSHPGDRNPAIIEGSTDGHAIITCTFEERSGMKYSALSAKSAL